MFPAPVRTGLSLTKVIGGIGKTLNVANQLIPIYMQARPMIQNAKNAFSIAKEVLSTPSSKAESMSSKKNNFLNESTSNSSEMQKKERPNSNQPVFFL